MTAPLKIGSLCTGYGGLELALASLADVETVFVSEIDPALDDLLAVRFPNAPNLGDIATIDDPPPVDILTAGFPCQPFSQAGKRTGTDHERWLWDDIDALLSRMGTPPGMLLLENVPGLLTANGGDAMARVVHSLAARGYLGSYRLVSASDVGACHRRTRWFCVAFHADTRHDAADSGRSGIDPDRRMGDRIRRGFDAGPSSVSAGSPLGVATHPLEGHRRNLPTPNAWDGARGPDLARADSVNSGGMDLVTTVERLLPTPSGLAGGQTSRGGDRKHELLLGGIAKSLPTPTVADARGSRRSTARTDAWTSNPGTTLTDVAYGDTFGEYAAAVARHADTIGRPPPPPAIDRRLSPAFVEWMMLLPPGWVTDLDRPRSDLLRILGNGVVPLQAAAATRSLTPAAVPNRKANR